jgi:hypothetical protein
MRPQVALLPILVAVLVGAFALTGCGGGSSSSTTSSESPATLIAQTFGSDAAVKSGRITLGAKGAAEGSGDFDLELSAKFDQAQAKQLPKLDGTLHITSSGGSLQAGAISTGTKGFLTVAGTSYAVSDADFASFTKSYLGDQRKTATTKSSRPTLGALGIHPENWLKDPVNAGKRTVGAAPTVHITAGVDVAKMLADVETIVAKNDLSSQLSASDVDQLGASVKSATVDVDTGVEDHRLRRLVIHLTLASGSVDLTLQYDDLDQPQTIVAPKNAQPITDLTSALAQLSGQATGSTGSGTATTTTTPQSGSTGSTAEQSKKYAACLKAAGQDLAKVQACAKYL